jgi:hypothetical protein
MNLFEVIDGHVFPSTHALMLQPFKRIWENDSSEGKEWAMKVFTYVEFMCSRKKSNPFYGLPEDERAKAVKRRVFGSEDEDTDMDMMLACMEYKELLMGSTPSYELVETAIAGAQRLQKFLKNYDFDERTPHGAMVLKPADVQKALNTVPDTIKKLEEARDKIDSEIGNGEKMRNDREVGAFEE